jgi:hypothetical protein
MARPRHFVPGYDRIVPPGPRPSPIEENRIKLALMGFQSREQAPVARGPEGACSVLARTLTKDTASV